MKRAMTSLPVPLSPVTRTEASERAICSAIFTTRSMEGSCHTNDRLSAATASMTAAMSSGSGGSGMYSCAGLDGRDRGLGVRAGAAGDDGRADPLGCEGLDEAADGLRNVDHDEVRALGAKDDEPLVDGVRLRDLRAALHRDPGGGDQFAVQPPDDE